MSISESVYEYLYDISYAMYNVLVYYSVNRPLVRNDDINLRIINHKLNSVLVLKQYTNIDHDVN